MYVKLGALVDSGMYPLTIIISHCGLFVNRFGVLRERKRSPLVEYGWTEKQCYDWCKENDLLSPIYEHSFRGGCWFCHNQRLQELRNLRKNHPKYWELMLKWDKDSPCTFKSDGKTLHDLDKRFEIEDRQISIF